MMDYLSKYNYWIEDEYFDDETKNELMNLADEEEIKDRFYKNLEFGTAGLRGKLGAGTNRMNEYTVSLAAEGLARTIIDKGNEAMDKGICISYDVRHKSNIFAKIAAEIMAYHGIKTYLFDGIRSTPLVSYTIRKLNTISGIMVTASHNPKEYNGFKVYWEEGSQILDDIADEILVHINEIEDFSSIKKMDLEEAVSKGLVVNIGQEIDDEYNLDVLNMALNEDIDKEINIVYTPLNGTGSIPVQRILKERGFTNVNVVLEQEYPDPDFTTVGYPNPEYVEAFEYAIRLGYEKHADILIATDPDADRVASMVYNGEEFIFVNGNQMGALLVNYVFSQMDKKNIIPKNGALVKSIVTGDLSRAIADKYNIKTFETLTGFKNICGKANEFDITKSNKFIFGYEESIGYVYTDLIRDKDGISTTMLIAEMAAYYKKKGKTLLDGLNDIYKEFGYYSENLISIQLEGIEGSQRIKKIMDLVRKNPWNEVDGLRVDNIIDYQFDETSIPKSNVLKYFLENGTWFAIRPSGTEPKIKIYIYAKEESMEKSKARVLDIEKFIKDTIDKIS